MSLAAHRDVSAGGGARPIRVADRLGAAGAAGRPPSGVSTRPPE
jgi:hypothetical protein